MQLRLHAVFLLKSGTAIAVPAVPVAPPMMCDIVAAERAKLPACS